MRHKKYLAVLLATILATGFMLLAGCSNNNEEPEETTTETTEESSVYGDESLGIDAKVDEELRDYRTILLTGLDNGSRSDMLIVLTFNTKTGEAKTVPVHRDTYMQVADGEPYKIDGAEREFFKCNRSYKKGGKYELIKELNHHMDLNIREIVAIDWDGIAIFVDAIGGLEADVSEEMIPFINKAEGTTDSNKLTEAGHYKLNGWQAVQYLRVRKYAGGNAPVREERSQEVIMQLKKQLSGLNLSEISDIYDQVAGRVDTNMSRTTLTETIVEVMETNLESSPGWPYEYSEMWQDDSSYYYFVPDTLESNVIELHKELFGQENYTPSEEVKYLNDRIETLRKEQLY